MRILRAVAGLLLSASVCDAAVLSSKRGFADTSANYENLQATGAGWYYTWGLGEPDTGGFDANHIPMFWGGGVSPGLVNNLTNRQGLEWILGFNEPERPDQSNLTVDQALSNWNVLSNGVAGTDIKLISPGVADTGGADGGQAWLSNFMSELNTRRTNTQDPDYNPNLRVDAIAFHWYGASTPDNPAGAASSFLSRVASYHNQYNLPIFITEFAIHDWGGNYTDAQIIDANRQFLDIVVPELESRDYVAGYAWYHWFTDSPLYSGNPNTPTDMGQRYVGALMPGQSEDFGGKEYGEHVAYLAGGELTLGSGSSGSLHYISALSSSSTISGNVDWGLSGSDWVRIDSDATLRKSGSNRITWDGIPVRSTGTIDIAEGELMLSNNTAVFGGSVSLRPNGTMIVDGARLDRSALILRGGHVSVLSNTTLNSVTIYNTTTFDVEGSLLFASPVVGGSASMGEGIVKRGAGTLTLSQTSTYNGDTEVLEGALVVNGSTGLGQTVVSSDAILRGGGVLRGDLLAQSGATVRPEGLRIEGDFNLLAGSSLQVMLFSEELYSRVVIDGSLDALGALRIDVSESFIPSVGQSFDLLDASGITGGFEQIELPMLDAAMNWDLSDLLTTGVLRVVAAASLPGDYNSDGVVDAADYTVWRDSVGLPAGSLPNDSTGEAVGPAQYAQWAAQYGSVPAWLTPIPEPRSWVLTALFACIVVPTYARRNSRRRADVIHRRVSGAALLTGLAD